MDVNIPSLIQSRVHNELLIQSIQIFATNTAVQAVYIMHEVLFKFRL